MEALWQDIRYGARTLRRNPWHTGVILLTLALGIGANSGVFSVISNVLLEPLPYARDYELVRVRQESAAISGGTTGLAVDEIRDYGTRGRAFQEMVEYHTMFFHLLGHGEPERVQTGVVSWDFFQVLGVEPLHGRTFVAGEDHLGAEPVLVLGHDYWIERFGGDPAVVGTTVEMNDRIHTIVGVLPPVPTYPNENDVWMPWYACPFRSGEGWYANRQARGLTVIGRLEEGATPTLAEAEMGRVIGLMKEDHPEAYARTPDLRGDVTPLREELTAEARTTFLLLLGMAGFVLLICCANVANLTLARMARRRGELSVRAALGAGRARLVRQMTVESLLLALAGGALGLAVAAATTGLLSDFAARFTPRAGEVEMDRWVLLFTLGISLVTGLAVGVLPALSVGRDVSGTLREDGGKATAGRGSATARSALVVGQTGLAVVLLVGAGLMLRSFAELRRIDPGFDPEGVLSLVVDLDFTTYTDAERRMAFWDGLLDRVRSRPGVVSAGVTSNTPLGGSSATQTWTVEGETPRDGAPPREAVGRPASAGYFETMRIPLLRGRAFDSRDQPDSEEVAVVSASFARDAWPGADPVGRRLSNDGGQSWATVVGVVGDVVDGDLENARRSHVYLPQRQAGGFGRNLVVRTDGDPMALSRVVTADVHAIDARQPVAFVQTLEDVHREALASPRLTALLLGVFAAVALAVSLAGVLGLVAYAVSRRTREMGVRMALGAGRGSLLALVMGQGMRLTLAGLVLGLAASLLVGRLLSGLLYGVPPHDPATLAGVAVILLSTAAVAVWIPAHRATRIHPVQALRSE